MPGKVWYNITHRIRSINGWHVEVWEWVIKVTPHIIMDAIIFYARIEINAW